MKHQDNRFIRPGFYLLWFTISIVQASYTQLIPDEAYYWTWSQRLDWGYFDHPPLIAIMIKCGYWLFQNEMGVRLLMVCCSTAFIFIIEQITKPANKLLFYCSILSIGILHFYGFIAVPDSPLLFFAACFFALYREYLKKDDAYIVLLLALDIALLLLSKYHGILIIAFTVASHPALLKKRSAWIVFVLSALFLIPHALWQYRHGAPSIAFQLFQRAHENYDISLTASYLASLLIVFGPLAGTALLFFALKYKPASPFEKALKYNLTGTLIFFALMTFKGRVETNWVNVAVIPVVCLGYKSASESISYRKIMIYSLPFTIASMMLARVFIAYDFLPAKWRFANDFHGYKEMAGEIKTKAGGRQVAFMNSYQKAAEYQFYTGQSSFSLNNMAGRPDQYNLWDNESKAQGKEVMLFYNYNIGWQETFQTSVGPVWPLAISSFHSASNIRISFADKQLKAHPGQRLTVNLSFSLRDGSEVDVEADKGSAFLSYMLYNGRKRVADSNTTFRVSNKMLMNKETCTIIVDSPKKKGKYQLFLAVGLGLLPQSINSNPITIEVN